MLNGALEYIVSAPLLDEYRRVLWRPQARRRHGLTPAELEQFLTVVAKNGHLLAPPPADSSPPDPGDQHLYALLEAEPEAVLVTGDRALLASGSFPGRILGLREFVELYLPQ